MASVRKSGQVAIRRTTIASSNRSAPAISSTIPKIPNFPNDIAALKQRLEADF